MDARGLPVRLRDDGLTLVELVIVLLIVGVLAAIVVGTDTLRARARDACMVNNARIIQTLDEAGGNVAEGEFFDVEPGDCDALGEVAWPAAPARHGS